MSSPASTAACGRCARRECRGFRALRADGFAHHPYSLDTAPGASAPTLDRVQIGELGKLTGLLAELHRRGRIERKLPLFLTEYGYETNPPDPRGVAPEVHARYLGHATYLGWRQPEVKMFPQFLLQDVGPDETKAPRKRWHEYQTGLFHHDGRVKRDVLQGFRLPFHVELRGQRGRREVLAFGQVRPAHRPAAGGAAAPGPQEWLDARGLAAGDRRAGQGGLRRLPHRPPGLLCTAAAVPGQRALPRGMAAIRREAGEHAPAGPPRRAYRGTTLTRIRIDSGCWVHSSRNERLRAFA